MFDELVGYLGALTVVVCVGFGLVVAWWVVRMPGRSFDDGDVLQDALDGVTEDIAAGRREPLWARERYPGTKRCPHCGR